MIRTLLVALDLEPSSDDVVTGALPHVAAGARVVLAHVVPEAPLTFPEGYVPIVGGPLGEPDPSQLADTARRALEPLAERFRAAGATVEIVVSSGPAAATIVDLVDTWEADLVVLGSHGRRGVARVLVGSVAEAVLRRAKVPTLVVPVRRKP